MISTLKPTRRDFIKTSLAGVATAGALPLAVQAQDHGKPKMLPIIEAPYWIDADGKETTFNMSEVRGKWLFLECFQKWCPGCKKYGLPGLQKITQEFGDDERIKFLAIQTAFEGYFFNDQGAVRKIQKQYELPIKMAHDPGNIQPNGRPITMTRFRTGGTPWTIIAAPNGEIIFSDVHVEPDRFIAFMKQQLA